MYNLADRAFNHTSLPATSTEIKSEAPPSSSSPTKADADEMPVKQEGSSSSKRPFFSFDDDSDVEVLPHLPSKRPCNRESPETNRNDQMIDSVDPGRPSSPKSATTSAKPQEQARPPRSTIPPEDSPAKSPQEERPEAVVEDSTGKAAQEDNRPDTSQQESSIQEKDQPNDPPQEDNPPDTSQQESSIQEKDQPNDPPQEDNPPDTSQQELPIQEKDQPNDSPQEDNRPDTSQQELPIQEGDQSTNTPPPMQDSPAILPQEAEASNNAPRSKSPATAQREDPQADPPAPSPQDSVFAQAMRSLCDVFLDKVDDRKFSRFVRILRDKKKAATFLFLVHHSNISLCQT
ncbi:hypothetical protein PTTG_05328 [Puccinia triticina 1-1 BBBD Race 1]|uniref:Uncharacterized protein n=1 Tax=Puccinia triticina (isolate 1-1 / race 1 (BBBD)) TaxID=630390 RepID=A0A0C4EWY1_PUCT1|nr:hypothetical protein PTTG_05328 [Puccinia triticina 1-1 BBBD Race 1]